MALIWSDADVNRRRRGQVDWVELYVWCLIGCPAALALAFSAWMSK